MNDLDAKPLEPTRFAKSLSTVLDESERVTEIVKESADELSSVNRALKQELAEQDLPSVIEKTLEKSEAVETKVQEAAEKLSAVNRALGQEVKEREIVEHQLAAIIEQEEAARYAALHDVLTGLPNRVLFNDRLEHGIAQAKRHGWALAVMFIDLDKFKSVNDTYGHDAGDTVLKTAAQRLKENSRDDDTISRYGGDEFLYLLAEVDQEADIVKVAEKIIAAIGLPCKLHAGGQGLDVSIAASIGIAIFPKDGATGDAMVHSADRAMYIAKKNKSGYAFAS